MQSTPTFCSAEASITRAQWRLRLLAVALPLFVLPLILAQPDPLPQVASLALPILTLVPLFCLLPPWMFGHLRHIRLTVAADHLVRESPAGRETRRWATVTQVRARYRPTGQLQRLDIVCPGQPPLRLAGYAQMEELGRLIAAATAPHAVWQRHAASVAWEHPVVFLAALLAVGGTSDLCLLLGGLRLLPLLNGGLALALGLGFLGSAPLAREQPQFRWLDWGLGGLLIVGGLLRLLSSR